ncbi:general substrate transporter [Rhizodiscina lignyota]|uniref:General substrate transporter n=1 Tax=Rhizodiscina lignyota TaxID=1504668 RepID=A0A9P4IKT6_9PEZI|nr:general substrate transporter [Rhizodiscina lignyota]
MTFLQRIVKNESMKQDPPEIYGWRAFVLALSACFGGMLFGMDIGTIGGVLTLPAFEAKYGLDGLSKSAQADLSANIASTLQAGCFFGALLASWVADKLGRRIGLMIAAVVTIVGVVIQAASSGSVPAMYIGRLVAGFGVGAASMIVPLYISESAPRAIRGGLTGIYQQLYIACGTMLAFWVNYGSIQHLKGKATYVVPLTMQSLPAICLLVFISLCHESPRFLAKQDKWDQAEKVLTTVRQLPSSHPYIRSEITDIAEQLEHERMLIGGASFKDLQKEMWLIPGNRKRALISIGLMVCQQMTGTNAINYYAPQIFQNLGIKGTSTGLFATGIYGVVKMVTCACFLLFAADSLGRRKSLLWTSIAQGCAMFYVGLYVRISPPVAGADVPPAGYVALVCIFLFAGFFQFGWGPVCWIYVSEIPTARLRSMNVAIAAATQWLFNFVVARATLTMFVTCGRAGYGTFLIYGSFCFSMFFFVWFFVPETKGLSLEKMDDLFGVTELVKKVEEEHATENDGTKTVDDKTVTPQVTERIEKA